YWRCYIIFFFSSRRRHTSFSRDWSSDVCSSDLLWPIHPYLPSCCMKWQFLRRRCSPFSLLPISHRLPLWHHIWQLLRHLSIPQRSEERRVGKECRTRGAPQ